MGDAHVYKDHCEALEIQITREPRDFPTLELTPGPYCSIDGWTVDDFKVIGYEPHKTIAMKMSV
jgi:thymidylate synthase